MIAVLALVGCGGPPSEAPPLLPVAAERATFATVAGLGAYRLRADVRRSVGGGDAPAQVSTEAIDLRWRDPDHWSYAQRRDDRVRSEIVVWDAVAWTNGGDGPLVRKGDAEPYRVQLAGTWDPWSWALEGLSTGIRFEPAEVELVGGRRALRHTLVVAPPAEQPRRGWTVTAVEGEVWIDEATAVRLKGTVTVDAVSGPRTQEVTLAFAMEGVGEDPEITAPRGDMP